MYAIEEAIENIFVIEVFVFMSCLCIMCRIKCICENDLDTGERITNNN